MPFSQPRNMPPRQVLNLDAGGTKLNTVRTGESGSLGVTMSTDRLGKPELVPGDAVVMLPGDFHHTFEQYLPRQDA